MLFENKFLRILSLGPPTGSKPFGLAVIILVYSEVGGPEVMFWEVGVGFVRMVSNSEVIRLAGFWVVELAEL